jgi:hypothetical protein
LNLIMGNPYTTCTAMFRVAAIDGYEKVARRLKARMDDFVIWLYIAQRYKIWYSSDVTAVYRVRLVSASHFVKLSDAIRFRRSAYKVASFFNKRYGDLCKKEQIKSIYRKRLLEFCLNNRLYRESIYYFGSIGEYFVCFSRVLARPIYLAISHIIQKSHK